MEDAITRILIAEDEQPQREALAASLAQLWPDARVVASCGDGISALEAWEREQPQVAFVDLRMPGAGGLELARAMADSVFVVFVTAHDDAAVQAFEHGAVDYLLKPVERERLALTIARLQERLRSTTTPQTALGALAVAGPPASLKWVTATVRETTTLYAIDDVIAFQAQDKYTRVLTATDDAVIRTSLRELLRGLDPEVFWHVHRSLIVRATAIEKLKRDELGQWLKLKGQSEWFAVSQAFHSRLRHQPGAVR